MTGTGSSAGLRFRCHPERNRGIPCRRSGSPAREGDSSTVLRFASAARNDTAGLLLPLPNLLLNLRGEVGAVLVGLLRQRFLRGRDRVRFLSLLREDARFQPEVAHALAGLQ